MHPQHFRTSDSCHALLMEVSLAIASSLSIPPKAAMVINAPSSCCNCNPRLGHRRNARQMPAGQLKAYLLQPPKTTALQAKLQSNGCELSLHLAWHAVRLPTPTNVPTTVSHCWHLVNICTSSRLVEPIVNGIDSISSLVVSVCDIVLEASCGKATRPHSSSMDAAAALSSNDKVSSCDCKA